MKRKMDVKRKNDVVKALRKQRIWKEIYREDIEIPLHKFSKGKVHCSCPMCAAKTTKRHAKFGTNGRLGKNWKPSDVRRILAANEQVEEFKEAQMYA